MSNGGPTCTSTDGPVSSTPTSPRPSGAEVLSESAQFRTTIQGQIASLRDVAKWLAGGVSVAAAGLIAGGALASFGSLEVGPRLWAAIVGGLFALAALGAILWRALDVLTARRLPLTAFSDNSVVPQKERKYLEGALADLFPRESANQQGRIRDFQHLEKAMQQIVTDLNGTDPDLKSKAAVDAARLNRDLLIFVPAATFEELRYRFLSLRRRVMGGGVVLVLGLTAFVWAVNPPKDPTLLARPQLFNMTVDPLDKGAIDKSWGNTACTRRPTLDVLVIRRFTSGLEDVVTVPTTTCPESVRLQREGGRLLTADGR